MNTIHIKFAIPTAVTIVLFAVATFFIIIKPFENRIKKDKREMIRSLTDTAWSILESSHREELAGRLTREEAQEKALDRVRWLRYGKEHKDYFWVSDMSPRMMVHPWRPELNGQDLSELKDPTGKRVFVAFVDAVKESGEAYVDYQWQWKDDPERVEPKLSYVKSFEPWGWIVGTGVYMDDVETEVSSIKRQVGVITGLITLVGAILLAYFVQQGVASERRRRQAENQLVASRDKYQSLVEASTEGMILIMAGHCVFANKIFTDMSGYTCDELGSEWGAKLLSQEDLAKVVENDREQELLEVQLISKDGEALDVILSTSMMEFNNQRGRIFAFKDVTRDRQLARAAMRDRQASQREQIIAELQAAQLFMNQPVSMLSAPMVAVKKSQGIGEVAKIMTEEQATAAIVQAEDNPVLGIITDHDLRIHYIAKGAEVSTPAEAVMTAPVITVDENMMIFEAALKMDEAGVQHLVVLGREGQPKGIVSSRELVRLHTYSSVNLVKEIHNADSVATIKKANARLPLLTQTLIRSGLGAEQITRTITTVTDAVSRRLLELAIVELGEPPVEFAFLALGSEGRREQTLATDQDNIIIYEDVELEKSQAATDYFNALGTRVCDWLDDVGYKYCPGEIMAKNPEYCQPLSAWKRKFTSWIVEAGPQELLDIHIFFDFRTLFGSELYQRELNAHIGNQLEESQSFFIHFSENCLLYRPPVTMFGKIAVKSGGDYAKTFDIKEAMKPIVNFARLYAIREGVEETNTIERLKVLADKGIIQKQSLNELVHIYSSLMRLRFEHQADDLSDGREPGNHVDPVTLTDIEKAMLKEAFSQINTFQNRISFDFRGRAL